MLYTSGMQAGYKWDVLMTGKENYPIIGDFQHNKKIRSILKKFKGLRLYWDCIEKAKITASELGGSVVVGTTYVWSGDFTSQYGFQFNPPYELHAWCQYKGNIIDLALPGVVKMGLELKDNIGPYLINRKPVIFAGSTLPKFLIYQSHEILEG